MNSSLLPLSDSASEPTTIPLPPSYWSHSAGLPAATEVVTGVTKSLMEESTCLQDDAGNLQPTKHSFKNKFEIIRKLGQGGFSTTYFAYDNSTAHALPCVIKHLKQRVKAHHQLNTNLQLERTNRRFQREARMMARLGRHAQLPRIIDHFSDNNQFYIVQEHIPGRTLSQEIRQDGLKSEQQAKQFLWEMIPIIRYIHRQRLLHLDIKPSNIIRRQSDQSLVLIDFGAVRRYPNDDLLPTTDRCVGTIGFSPAEQLAGKPTYASDVYALGVTCLYLLTGISPLDLATAEKGQHLRWQESIQLSEHFTTILEKMLSTDLGRRFQDIEELDRAMTLEAHYDDLKDCLTTEPLTDKTFKSPVACSISDVASAGSQSQRQAASIRRWQQRRRQFKAFTPK